MRALAPTVAVRGNIDRQEWSASLPATEVVEVGRPLFWLLHDIAELDLDPAAAGFAGVIFEGGEVGLALDMEDMAPPSGSLSDPRLATAERGQQIVQRAVDRLARFMQWFKGIDPHVKAG